MQGSLAGKTVTVDPYTALIALDPTTRLHDRQLRHSTRLRDTRP